MYAMVR